MTEEEINEQEIKEKIEKEEKLFKVKLEGKENEKHKRP